MEITKRVHDSVVVFDLGGRLASTIGGRGGLSERVLAQLAGRADDRGHHVLLNLAHCTGADSLGIGELISLHVSLSKRGGSLKLLDLPRSISDLLRATQLIDMFDVFDDEGEALESFG